MKKRSLNPVTLVEYLAETCEIPGGPRPLSREEGRLTPHLSDYQKTMRVSQVRSTSRFIGPISWNENDVKVL